MWLGVLVLRGQIIILLLYLSVFLCAGLYLTDLCFLHDLPNKGSQVESTLNMIAYCQNSTYGEVYSTRSSQFSQRNTA